MVQRGSTRWSWSGAELHLHPDRSLGDIVQQQQLGEGIYGVVSITAMCTWSWETDWTVGISWQRSGADVWRHAKMEGVPDPDVGEALRQLVAEAMGYV